MTGPIITFEYGGFPIELTSEKDIQKAIATGRLRADTIVTIRAGDGSAITRPADSVDLLRQHLGIRDPEPEPPPETDPEPFETPVAAPDVVEMPMVESDQAVEPASSEQDQEDFSGPFEPFTPPLEPAPAPAQTEMSTKPWLYLAGGLGALVLLVAVLSGGGNGSSGYVSPSNDVGASADNMTTPVDQGPAVREIGTAQTFYAARAVKVRAHATGDSAEIGALSRGDSIHGLVVARQSDNEEWVRVESGPHRGYFVWRRNLVDAQPPSLSRTVTENRVVPASASLYARPDSSATIVQTLDPGTSVHLAGELASGWWEVELSNGGVGYLSPDAFQAPGRYVRVINACSSSMSFQLTYQSRNGPETSNGSYWNIEGGESTFLLHQGNRLLAVADSFYYRMTDRSGFPRGQYQRANTYLDDSGNYVIRFFCND